MEDRGIDVAIDGIVNITPGMSLEAIVNQLQKYTTKLLYVEDGIYVNYYNPDHPLTIDMQYQYSIKRFNTTEYYLRSGSGTLYCVFGWESAVRFHPHIVYEIGNIIILPPPSKTQIVREIHTLDN